MSSPKRKRDVPVLFWVSADEMELIQQKMAQFGTKNLSAYLRKMAVDGYVVQLDLPELKELVSLMRYSSNNLNQLTRKAIQSHLPQIGTQVFCPILLHLLADQLQFLCGHPKQNRNIPLTLCHSYRSGSRFFGAAGLWAGSSCLSLSRTEGRDGCIFSP